MSDPTSAEVLAAVEKGLPWPGAAYLDRGLDDGERFTVSESEMGPEFVEIRLASGSRSPGGRPMQWGCISLAALREAPDYLPALVKAYRRANAAMLADSPIRS